MSLVDLRPRNNEVAARFSAKPVGLRLFWPLKKLLVQLFMVQGHTQITILPKSANQIGVSSMVSPQSGVLALNFVAPPPQIAAVMVRRRFASKAKIPLSGGGHSFLTGW